MCCLEHLTKPFSLCLARMPVNSAGSRNLGLPLNPGLFRRKSGNSFNQSVARNIDLRQPIVCNDACGGDLATTFYIKVVTLKKLATV